MKILFTLLLLLISISTTHAEEGIIKKPLKYDIEVIIFEDANARYINSEYLAEDALLTETATEAGDPGSTLGKTTAKELNKPVYKNIKPEMLNNEYKRINNSKEYNVLFYGSWRQTGLEEKKAFDLNIEELKNTHKISSENNITGNFKLILARYLHIYTELVYQRNPVNRSTEEVSTSSETSEQTSEHTTLENTNYPINMHRRMRSKELHYIDHPLVGILIQINPVKAEETTEKSAAQ